MPVLKNKELQLIDETPEKVSQISIPDGRNKEINKGGNARNIRPSMK